MNVTIGLDIDFDLLRKQKAMLINIAPYSDINEEAEGLIGLIDGIQECVAESYGEEIAYGSEEE